MRYPIEITADDGVTAVIKRVNDQFARLTAPFKRLTEYTQKLARASGLDRLARQLRVVASNAKAAGDRLSQMISPLTALIGGGTLAGLVALTNGWARLNFQLDRSARASGLSTADLQALRGVATGLGVDANAVASSFQGFDDVLQDAQFGRNPTALAMLNAMHVSLRRNRDGSIDTASAFKQLAGVIAGKAPEVQRLIARQFGVESLLPILSLGRKGIEEWEARSKALGAVLSPEQQANANRMALSLNLLQVAASGLQNEIASRLAPGMTIFFDKLTSWIGANRESIGKFFSGFGDWLAKLDFDKLANTAGRFLEQLNDIVDKLGGFKTIAIALGGIMAVNLLAPFASLAASLVLMAPALAAAWPVLAAMAAIGGVGYIGYQTYNRLNGIGDGSTPNGSSVARNNPLNLRSWAGRPQVGGFAAFDSEQAGYRAAAVQLGLYGSRGTDTLNEIIAKWAPASDGNNVPSYVKHVAQQTGFGPDQALDLRNPEVLSPLIRAMARHEQGAGFQIDQAALNRAVAEAVAGGVAAGAARTQGIQFNLSGVPAGMSVAAENLGVGQSMVLQGP